MIRKASDNDIIELLKLEQSGFGSDSFKKSQLQRLVSNSTSTILIDEESDKIVGSIIILHRIKCKNDRIYSLVVLPEFRGKGVANKLIASAESLAKSKGKSAITLEVREDNPSALSLYKKLGFEEFSRLPNYYHDKSQAIHMIKAI